MLDAREVEERTGWRVRSLDVVASTNDEAARAREGGEAPRWLVVADRQTTGRGRGGRRFASPPGGLYASLLVSVPPDAVPAPLVAAVATALAEAIEAAAGCSVQVKWPNDLWIEGRKVAGILAEAAPDVGDGDARVAVVVGVGVNLRGVPDGLEPGVAAATTAVDLHARRPVRREDLLTAFLPLLDRRLAALADAEGRLRLEADFLRRAALVGERVRFFVGDAEGRGVLRGISLARGLLVEPPDGPPAWVAPAHVRDLRREPS